MKIITALAVWLVLTAMQSFAQVGGTVTGHVVNEKDRLPVSDARVELAGTPYRATTARDGSFTFSGLVPGIYQVRASRVGYTSKTTPVELRADERSTLTLELQEASYLLDPVTSTATRRQSRASEVSSSVAVISGTELERRQAQDVSDAVQDVPGLFVRPYGALGDVRTASIRGSSAGQVLILMDGQRVNNTQSGEVDLTTLPVEGIDRVEIVRGGASALYGADAVGGVINVITKTRGVSEGMTADMKVLSGSYGTREGEIRGDYSSGKSYTALSYRYLKSNGNFGFHPAPDSSATRANADFLSHALFGKERWGLDERRTLSLTGQYFTNEAGDPGTISYPNSRARKRNRNVLLGLTYDEDLESVIQLLHVQTFYHNLLFNYEDPLAWVPILNNSHNIAAGGEVQTGLRFSDWNSMTIGYAYRWDHFSGNSLQGEYQRGLHSVYLVDEIAVRPWFLRGVPRVAIVPAVRWDRFSDFGAELSPKIGFVLNAGDDWLVSVKANYGRSFRAPTFNDLYWPRDPYTAGNPDLRPERATDYDAGATLDLPLLAGIGGSFTWFGSTVTDLILWGLGRDGVWSPANVGKAQIRGIETGLSVSPWRDVLTVRWNYTHLDAQNRGGENANEYGKKLPDRPADMHKITMQSSFAGFSASVDYLSVGMRYTTMSNSGSLPSYHLFNVRAGYAWEMARGRLELKGEVRNLGNVEYQVMEGYPVPGREFRVSLSFGVGPAAGK